MRGELRVMRYDKPTGLLLSDDTYGNMVVKGAYDYFISQAAGSDTAVLSSFVLGDDTTPVIYTDTNLGNLLVSGNIARKWNNGTTIVAETEIDDDTVVGSTYYEAGMKLSDGTLFSRLVFRDADDGVVGIPMIPDTMLVFRWTIALIL